MRTQFTGTLSFYRSRIVAIVAKRNSYRSYLYVGLREARIDVPLVIAVTRRCEG